VTTFSLTKAFTALLGELEGATSCEEVAIVCRSGHLATCPTKGSVPCFWCAAATMTPEVIDAMALWSSLTEALDAPVASWPSAIRARMAIYDLAELAAPTNRFALAFTSTFFTQVHERAGELDNHLKRQGKRDSELERSARQAAAITALPRMLSEPELAPPSPAFRRRLGELVSTKTHQLETMAILATEQLLAGQFMDHGAQGRALADLTPYLGEPGAATFNDLAWAANYYAKREQLIELANELMDLEEPRIVVHIAPVTTPYRLKALQSLVLRAQPIDWATTFVHATGGSAWLHDAGYLVTPSTALALQVWKDRHCASAIGISSNDTDK